MLDTETQASHGNFYLRYRPSCWWFEFTVMARKNALAAAAIFFSQNAVVASALSVAALVVLILVQAVPHRRPPLRRGEA